MFCIVIIIIIIVLFHSLSFLDWNGLWSTYSERKLSPLGKWLCLFPVNHLPPLCRVSVWVSWSAVGPPRACGGAAGPLKGPTHCRTPMCRSRSSTTASRRTALRGKGLGASWGPPQSTLTRGPQQEASVRVHLYNCIVDGTTRYFLIRFLTHSFSESQGQMFAISITIIITISITITITITFTIAITITISAVIKVLFFSFSFSLLSFIFSFFSSSSFSEFFLVKIKLMSGMFVLLPHRDPNIGEEGLKRFDRLVSKNVSKCKVLFVLLPFGYVLHS